MSTFEKLRSLMIKDLWLFSFSFTCQEQCLVLKFSFYP